MALAIDASSPAVATVTAATAVTTASFTPPAGALLLIAWAGNSSGAGALSITDNLGTHLTYTLQQRQSQADSPNVDGQVALWTAVVGSSAAMTVTVTSTQAVGFRQNAIKVVVCTDTTTPGVGVSGKAGSTSAASIAASYTAAASGGFGYLAVCDESALGAQTAGTGCTLTDGGTGTLSAAITYGFARRTTFDDVNGAGNTLNMTLPGTSTLLNWAWVEIIPAAGGGPAASSSPVGPEQVPWPVLQEILKVAAQPYYLAGSGTITWNASPPDDSAGLTDSVVFEQDKVFTDPAGLTDTTAFEQDKVVTDLAGLTDTVALTQSKVATDDTGLTDTSTVQLLKVVNATDDVGLTDTFALEQDKVVTDSAGLTDTTATAQAKVVTDDTGLTDTSTLVLAKAITADDPAGLTDTTALQHSLVLTDAAGLTDTTPVTQSKVVTDFAGLTDTSTLVLAKALTADDPAGLTDTNILSRTMTVTDDVGLSDPSVVTGGSVSVVVAGDATSTDRAGAGMAERDSAAASASMLQLDRAPRLDTATGQAGTVTAGGDRPQGRMSGG